MAKVDRAIKKGLRILDRALRTPGTLREMQGSADARIASLGHALGAALADQATAEERAGTDRIIALRRELETRKDDLEGLPAGQVAQADSRGHMWQMILFHLLREFKPQRCLELGTCLGLSAAYEGTALKLNGNGDLVTMELSQPRVDLARQNLARLELDNVRVIQGRFDETLAPWLQETPPLDFAFIDGHHDEHATQDYFAQILPKMSPAAVLVFDDILWSAGMVRAWDKIRRHPEIGISVDLHTVGICCKGPQASAGVESRYKISLG